MPDVTVRTPQGELFTGPQERVAELQKTIPGAQVLTPEEAAAAARQQTLREEQGGLTGAGVQFAESLIEGGTSLPIGQALERVRSVSRQDALTAFTRERAAILLDAMKGSRRDELRRLVLKFQGYPASEP